MTGSVAGTGGGLPMKLMTPAVLPIASGSDARRGTNEPSAPVLELAPTQNVHILVEYQFSQEVSHS
uniref:Uncharacterized protein n=1 Tax=Arundo donax TaxID=35708 RepID=A0A0A9HP61_ARUDO